MNLGFLSSYLVIVIIVLFSIWVGFALGRYIRLHRRKGKNLSLGSIVGAMLALLGFMLALTVSMVSSRYAARKELVLEEANALGTAILRTDFLQEPLRTESRTLLIKYVNLRAEFSNTNMVKVSKLLTDSETIQDELWLQVNKAPSEEKNTLPFALYVQSLNEVIDLHAKRYNQGIQYRLPWSIWLLLYFVTVLAMLAVGYEFGMNESGSLVGSLLLALMFAGIAFIISDLDKSAPNSLIKVSQKPMLDLQQKLNSLSK